MMVLKKRKRQTVGNTNKKEKETEGKAFEESLKKYKRQGNVSYKICQRRISSSKISCTEILIGQLGCRG